MIYSSGFISAFRLRKMCLKQLHSETETSSKVAPLISDHGEISNIFVISNGDMSHTKDPHTHSLHLVSYLPSKCPSLPTRQTLQSGIQRLLSQLVVISDINWTGVWDWSDPHEPSLVYRLSREPPGILVSYVFPVFLPNPIFSVFL